MMTFTYNKKINKKKTITICKKKQLRIKVNQEEGDEKIQLRNDKNEIPMRVLILQADKKKKHFEIIRI